MEYQSKEEDLGDLCTFSDSPRAKKLKKDIDLLRKKSKENYHKIHNVQAIIRRILHKQKENQHKRKATTTSEKAGLKRTRSDDDSEESRDSAPSPTENVGVIDFEIDEEVTIKYELMDYENTAADPPPVSQDCDVDTEAVVDVIKTEPEDDPLHLNRGVNVFASKVDEVIPENNKCCDEGFLPATGENVPMVDSLAITEFLAALPDYNRERMRALWRQANNMIEDSIGYVQLKTDGKSCTVKCEVATKSTSNHCTISYNEVYHTVQAATCDCDKTTTCIHILAALVWLGKPNKGLHTYWILPMVSRDASSMKLNAIFDLPKISYQKKYTVLNEFIRKCAENENFSPVLMKYYQDERPTASLHMLMREYSHTYNNLDVEIFLSFCREKLSKDPIFKRAVPLSPKVIQELEYGRIADCILWDVCEATEDSARDLLAKIMYPQVKEAVIVKHGISHSLEMSLNMKIRKCSLLISDTSPIFSATPYGVTKTNVIYIKKLAADQHMSAKDGNKLSLKDTARMQLQMFLTKRKNACYCEVLADDQIVISILNYNEKWLMELLKKATKFWQIHVFKQIKENLN